MDDPELSLEDIYATLPNEEMMLSQILQAFVLSSNTSLNLDKLDALQVGNEAYSVTYNDYNESFKVRLSGYHMVIECNKTSRDLYLIKITAWQH